MLFNEGEDVRFQGTDEDGLVHVLCCGYYRVVIQGSSRVIIFIEIC